MGISGDSGQGVADVDAATEIAGWYDMTDVWRTAEKVLSAAVWGMYLILDISVICSSIIGRVAGSSGHEESARHPLFCSPCLASDCRTTAMRWNSKIFEYVTFRPRMGRICRMRRCPRASL